LTNYAVIYKDLKFTVFDGGKALIRVSPARTLFERIHGLAGAELAKSLLPFDGKSGEIRAFGYCSSTNHKRSSRDGLHFYINGRSVDDKLLSSSVAASYKSLIPPGSYPSVFLFVELPFEQVDVNVHPAKMEARFRSPNSVRQVIEESIRAALIKSSPVLNIKAARHGSLQKEALDDARSLSSGTKVFSDYLSEGLPDIKPGAQEKQIYETAGNLNKNLNDTEEACVIPAFPVADELQADANKEIKTNAPQPAHIRRRSTRSWKQRADFPSAEMEMDSSFIPNIKETEIHVIGQLLNSFILAQGGEDLLIIDQHIAHERIRYEQLKEQFASSRIESQSLLIPETFEVTREDDIALRELAGSLAPLGFQIEPFSGHTWAVKALPVEMETSGERVVREMLDLFEDIKSSGREGILKERLNEELIALIACHGSIKKNMFLTKDKMEWLLAQLALCKEPYRCPHGRPVILRIERNELFKKFGRDIH
jgi:DNA mismatch repair protein MutL